MRKRERTVRHFSERCGNRLLSLVNGVLSWVEHRGARWHRCGRWYRDRFYRRLVERELKSISLDPDATVLHIGCGPLPMTALYLSQMGFHVKASDCNPAAVRSARKVVSQSRDERIAVWEMEGDNIDYSPFDAVWVSLAVDDKRRVVVRALQTLKPGAPVLYRNYRGKHRDLGNNC